MRHVMMGILVLCLTLAADVASAQKVVSTEIFIDWENVTEEQKQQFFDQTGLTLEELQHRIDSGAVQVARGGIEFDISDEDRQRMMEQQHRQEEMLQALLADVGVTEEELELYVNNLGERMQPYVEQFEEYRGSIDVTMENYIEVIGVIFDDFLVPIVNDFRAESLDFFTEEQYATLMTRLCQLNELGELNMFGGEIDESFGIFINDLWVMSDAVGLTEEQFQSLVQAQKDFVAEVLGEGIMLEQEEELLKTQLTEAQTDEERADIQKRLEKFREESDKAGSEIKQRLRTKMRRELDTLLTAEQKAKLTQIKADIPDYMRSALAGMKPDGIHDNAEEASGPWRPGANSWVPGMGAPTNLKNDNREAPRVREPRGGRRFPGSE